ncbi:T9SS type A sorting domain-containing protein [Proteiniphilum saccharofermentans]|uniref:T9SS type A sorting domain-containing protein n=1 Tax=Proteiniphilum saccharofermentans TaxID=1642647 RepID=UPI0028A74642|nr:T9SS type A sorting domain-containing protein [Proteiniphilum saccharofermentans]
MEKKLLSYITLSFLFFSTVQSQVKLSENNHNFRRGDVVYKYQAKYREPGVAGQEQIWDFSKLHILDDHYQIKYFYPSEEDTTSICGLEHGTRYYYRIQRDSIWSTGFENYTTFLKYNKPELKIKFPLHYGDILNSTWEGEGIYGNLFPLNIKGYTEVFADAEGQLILPAENVIDSVLRVHTVRYYEETGKDSLKMTLDMYSWYSPHNRHPIFESIETILHRNDKDTTVFSTSFYYLPEKWSQIEDEEKLSDSLKTDKLFSKINEKSFNDILKEEEEGDNSSVNAVLTNVRMAPNPVKDNLTVQYELIRRAQVQFALYNISGILLLRTPRKTLIEGRYTELIPMRHLMIGTYVVHVYVDDLVLSRLIIKK